MEKQTKREGTVDDFMNKSEMEETPAPTDLNMSVLDSVFYKGFMNFRHMVSPNPRI